MIEDWGLRILDCMDTKDTGGHDEHRGEIGS